MADGRRAAGVRPEGHRGSTGEVAVGRERDARGKEGRVRVGWVDDAVEWRELQWMKRSGLNWWKEYNGISACFKHIFYFLSFNGISACLPNIFSS
jgi:hypothetical protein